MFKNWKRLIMTIAAISVVASMMFPFAAFANVATTAAAVKGFTADNTSITAGQSTTVDVSTNTSATFVFAVVDGARVYGSNLGSDSAGNINWRITFSPSVSQTVPIYVNSADTTDGAVVLNVRKTVVGSAGDSNLVSAVSTVNGVSINGVIETRGASSNSAILTIETNDIASDVWVQFDNDKFAKARLDADSGSVRRWTVTIRPSRAQTVTVSANTGYYTRGAASLPFNVTLGATGTGSSVSGGTGGRATISSVRAGNANLLHDETTTLTIVTNTAAEYVWVEVDSRDVYASVSRESRTTKTWTVRVSPNRTQRLTIYANSVDDTSGAVSRNLSITVSDRRNENARIVNVSDDGFSSQHQWGYSRLNIETNNAANNVWVMHGGTRIGSTTNFTTLSNGNRRWFIDLDHNWGNQGFSNTITVTVHAGETNNVSNDSRSHTLSGWWGGGAIWEFGGNGNIGSGLVTFWVTTDTGVSSIQITGPAGFGSQSFSASSHSHTSGNQRFWNISVGHSVINPGSHSFTVFSNNYGHGWNNTRNANIIFQ
jgi:hypothetical protein